MSATHWWVHGSIRNCCWPINWICSRCTWHYALTLIFQVFEFKQALSNLPLPLFLLNGTLTDCVHSFPIHKIAGTWPSRILTTDSFPVLLEIGLDVLQAIKSWHLAWFLRWWSLMSLALSLGGQLGGHLPIKASRSRLGLGHVLLSPLVSLRGWLSGLVVSSTTICIMRRILTTIEKNEVKN